MAVTTLVLPVPTTTPYRLGRHVEHDDRSRDFEFSGPRRSIDQDKLWTFSKPVLNQGNTSSCFPPGTLVRMADGSERSIEDIRLGEYVVTAEGGTGRVTRMMLRDENSSLCHLMLWGSSHLKATAEHPILTRSGYIPISELRSDDEVALPRYGNNRSEMDDCHVWRRVRCVKNVAYSGPVYDLTIEGDHSYVAEGIGVHNCVGNTFAQFVNTDFCAPTRAKLKVEWETESQALECYHLATIADGVSDQVYPPADDGTSSLGGAKAAQQLGWIDRYEHAFDFNTFQSAIQTQPVCVGTLWTNQMFNADSNGLISVGPLGDVNDPNNQYIAGGHEYLGMGISYTLKQVRFLTSWSAAFGINGEFMMSFDDFETLIENQGDIIVPHGV